MLTKNVDKYSSSNMASLACLFPGEFSVLQSYRLLFCGNFFIAFADTQKGSGPISSIYEPYLAISSTFSLLLCLTYYCYVFPIYLKHAHNFPVFYKGVQMKNLSLFEGKSPFSCRTDGFLYPTKNLYLHTVFPSMLCQDLTVYNRSVEMLIFFLN